MANGTAPDQSLHIAASDLGLHCLLMPICQNTLGKYGICLINKLFLGSDCKLMNCSDCKRFPKHKRVSFWDIKIAKKNVYFTCN